MGTLVRVGGTTSPNIPTQGAYLSWNALSGGLGETDFINQRGGGGGGFAFFDLPTGQYTAPLPPPLVQITGSGEVGIGTSNPQAALDVRGATVANSLTEAEGLVDVAKGLTPTISGGSLYDGGPTYRGATSQWSITAANQTLTIDLGYVVDGIQIISFDTYWRGDTHYIPAGYSIKYSSDNATFTQAVSISENTSAAIRHVVNFSARYIQITVTALQPGYSPASITGLQILAAWGAGLWGTNPWSSAGPNLDNLFLALTGNVGIGTSTPRSTLEVNGNIAVPANSVLHSSDDFGNYLMPYESGTGRMVIWTGANERMCILHPNGNVGIGTPSPSALLDVNGLISASGAVAITAQPPAVSSNVGWKIGLYGNQYAIGVAGYSVAVASSGWLSVFVPWLPPLNNGSSTTPDSNAQVSLGANGQVRCGQTLIADPSGPYYGA